MHNVMLWIKGLIAAIVGGAANGVTVVIVAPDTFNFSDGMKKLGMVVLASSIVSAAMYLKQSPVPNDTETQKAPGVKAS